MMLLDSNGYVCTLKFERKNLRDRGGLWVPFSIVQFDAILKCLCENI